MSTVYLIPSLLHEEGVDAIPPYIREAVLSCEVLFVENERTARRFLKKMWKEIVIDHFEWYTISDHDQLTTPDKTAADFRKKLLEGKTIGIISEAGCPAVADPGQSLVAVAQSLDVNVKPLVGPSAILLALMASGMNGQQFHFHGYLPIPGPKRSAAIKELETESKKRNSTQIFIETPYRNQQMMEALLSNCADTTLLCFAMNLTGKNEWIKTKPVGEWKKNRPEMHRHPAIFLLYAGLRK